MTNELTPSERAAREWMIQALPRGYWAAVSLMSGLVIYGWFDVGPGHPGYAVVVVGWTLILGLGVAGPVMQRVPRHWFRVPAWERVIHRGLGVGKFRRLLEWSGWEGYVHKREFRPNRAGLRSLEVALRSNVSAHGTCFAIHMAMAALALFSGHPQGVAWMLLPGIVVHLYPVLLQRTILLRLQPLLDK